MRSGLSCLGLRLCAPGGVGGVACGWEVYGGRGMGRGHVVERAGGTGVCAQLDCLGLRLCWGSWCRRRRKGSRKGEGRGREGCESGLRAAGAWSRGTSGGGGMERGKSARVAVIARGCG